MKLILTTAFKRCYAELSAEEAKLVKYKLVLLSQNPHYPSLQTRKMGGKVEQLGIYQMQISDTLRITFTIEEDAVYLRRVGRGG